jgi:hypothetical protein
MIPNMEECRRILGVSGDASAETIRQAYLDLVRVWHPDRFQSDARLRQIADDNLCRINNAYAVLKDRPNATAGEGPSRPRTAETRATSGSDTATMTEEAPPKTAPSPFRQPLRRRQVPRGWAIAICCAGPVWAMVQAGMLLLRVPALDAGPILQPRILEPMRFIDPSLGAHRGGDVLTAWAHGDLMDLWKPISASAERSGGTARTTKRPASVRAQLVRQPETSPEQEAPPANGADLISPAQLSGRGDLHLANQTDMEAVARLVSGSGATVRAIYIAPKESAIFRSIAIGVYTLHVELGRNLDVRHLCFLNERSTLAPIGPFQFLEITSDEGVSGSHFQVALKPRA